MREPPELPWRSRTLRPVAVRALRALFGSVRQRRLRDLIFDALPSDYATVQAGEFYVVATRDKMIGKRVYIDGSFDFDKLEKAVALLRGLGLAVETLYDIGANIGTVSIPAVRRGLVRRAVCFEPEPGNFRLLVANVHLNGVEGRMRTVRTAVGDRDGQTLRLELSSINMGDHRIRLGEAGGTASHADAVDVPSDTLDRLAPDLDRRRDLLWIDVQGWEGQVLAGAARAVQAGVPLGIEVFPAALERTGGSGALRAAIARYDGYFDLAEADPTLHPIADFDALYASLTGERQTDLLFIAAEPS